MLNALYQDLKDWLTFRDARSRVCYWDAEACYRACMAMQRLNRFAAHRITVGSGGIYAMKHSLIRHLYYAGALRAVYLDRQEMPCWNCDGRGCLRCDDGVYTTHALYRFETRYGQTWHVPAAVLPYRYEAQAGETFRGTIQHDAPGDLMRKIALAEWAFVYWYLHDRAYLVPPDVNLPKPLTLRRVWRNARVNFNGTRVGRAVYQWQLKVWLLLHPKSRLPF